MNKEFFDALDMLEREKGIPKEYMLEKVEAALVSAFKRELGGSTNVRVVLDPKKKVRLYFFFISTSTPKSSVFSSFSIRL